MSRLVWAFGWIGVAIWSLVCLAVYGVFDLVGRLLSRNADAFATDPTTVEWLWRVLNFLHSLSTGAVVVAWAVVSLLILAVPWVLDRMLGAPQRGHVTARYRTGGPARRDDGIIDLAPDQYSVGPAPGRSPPPGPTPRILPRA